MNDDSKGLHLHVGDDAAALASEVARTVLRAVDDPFAQPLVLAPGAALQRWLSQRVATASPRGIRAGIVLAHPGRLESLVSGLDPRDDPWAPARLAWSVLEVAAAAPAGLEPLVANLDASDQRFSNASRVAGLLDRYAQHRPDMLASWSAAADVADLGLGFDAWQAVLWRALHDIVDAPDPVARRAALVAGIRAGTVAVPWPSVVLFRPRHLTRADADLLAAVATRVRVDAHVVVPAAGPPAALEPRLGRRGTEVLVALEAVASSVRRLPSSPTMPRVVVHASHGPDRQVAVLREVLTGLFSDDETLEPRDVAVACVDLERFTPHLQAAFTPSDEPTGWQHPGTELRVSVADRAASTTNRLYALLREVAQLGRGRATASDLVALASHPFVARRFRFTPDDLDRLSDLVGKAGVRWGVNDAHRRRFGLAGVRQGTWQVGVQRLLLGEALSDDALAFIDVIATVDDVESSDIELIGGLAELVTRAGRLASECLDPATGAAWVTRFRAMIDGLTSVPFDETWQLAQVWSALDDIDRRAGSSDTLLGLPDALALLDGALTGRGARPAFGTGALVVGTLAELATVPHRVLCVVGVDDRGFPRRGVGDGDDLLRARPRPGDPDAGADDRQALLDALGSARERLVVIYQGHSSLTHEVYPPASGLVDLIEACGVEPAHEALQPFSPSYFRAEPTSFDRASLRAARALVAPRAPRPEPFRVGYLPLPGPVEAVELEQVGRFLAHPAKYFLRQRAGLSLGDDDEITDDLPLELGGLERWKVGDRVLSGLVAGHPLERVTAQEWRRGELPPGVLGESVLGSVTAAASEVMAAREPWVARPAEFVAIDADAGGVRLRGRAALRGDVTLTVGFGNVSAKHLATAWLDALALTVQLGRRVDAVVVGGRHRHRLVAPPPDHAAHLLGQVVDLSVEGMQRVLPLPPRLAHRWAKARAAGQDPLADRALQRHWGYETDAVWAAFYPPGTPPWHARVTDQPWAQRGEPTELGSLAAVVWAPIVRADS